MLVFILHFISTPSSKMSRRKTSFKIGFEGARRVARVHGRGRGWGLGDAGPAQSLSLGGPQLRKVRRQQVQIFLSGQLRSVVYSM